MEDAHVCLSLSLVSSAFLMNLGMRKIKSGSDLSKKVFDHA